MVAIFASAKTPGHHLLPSRSRIPKFTEIWIFLNVFIPRDQPSIVVLCGGDDDAIGRVFVDFWKSD